MMKIKMDLLTRPANSAYIPFHKYLYRQRNDNRPQCYDYYNDLNISSWTKENCQKIAIDLTFDQIEKQILFTLRFKQNNKLIANDEFNVDTFQNLNVIAF